MGYGLPAAFGAAMGAPNRQVIAVIGDGGFQMTIQELATIWQHQVPVKILILNNGYLGMVRQWQELFFDKRYSFTTLTNPDFIAVTKGFGIDCHKVTKREDLDSSLEKFLNYEGPYLLEVEVAMEDNVFPMIPSGASVSDIILERPKTQKK